MRELRMPKLALGEGDTMTVLAWLVSEGNQFAEGDILVEVETDKATMEVDAPFGGELARIVCREGVQVEPGELLAWVAEQGEDYDPDRLPEATEDAAGEGGDSEPSAVPAVSPAEVASGATGAPSGPRSIATGGSVVEGDLRGLPGAGVPSPGDVAAPEPSPAPRPDPEAEGAGPLKTEALSRHRLAVGRVMTRSNQIPQFAVTRDLEVGTARRALALLRERHPAATLTDLFLRGVAQALVRQPAFNAWFAGSEVMLFEEVNIAVAVDGPDGVISPVVRSVLGLGPDELAAERSRLVEDARNGRSSGKDLQGATFTISNVGPLGADALLPMLTPPQVGILGLGRARVDAEGRELVTANVVGDHRAVDGADGARFLVALAEALSDLETEPAGTSNRHDKEGSGP